MAINKPRNRNLPATQRSQSVWNPRRELSQMQRNLDQIFEDMWSPMPMNYLEESIAFIPPVDVQETDNAFLVSFDLPGISKEDLKIEMRDNQLVVSGERKEEVEHRERGGRLASERFHGSFMRSMSLPANVDATKIEASFRDGVLHIAVPKTEATKTKAVEIKDASKGGILDKLLGHEKKKDEKAA